MNRALRVLAVALVTGALPALSGAQQSKTVALGLSGGVSMPSGTFGDRYNAGWTASAYLFITPARMQGPLNLRADFHYDHWQGTESAAGRARAIGVMGNALYTLGAKSASFRPFALAGVGFENLEISFPFGNGTGVGSSTKPALQGGAGVQFDVHGFATFLEARYVKVFGDNGGTTWLPISLGFHF